MICIPVSTRGLGKAVKHCPSPRFILTVLGPWTLTPLLSLEVVSGQDLTSKERVLTANTQLTAGLAVWNTEKAAERPRASPCCFCMRKTLLGLISLPPHLLGSFGHALVDNSLHLLCFPAWSVNVDAASLSRFLSHDRDATKFVISQKVAAEDFELPFGIASVARVRP